MHINTYKKMKKKNKNIEKLEFNYENDKNIIEFYKMQEKDKSWDNYFELRTPYDERYNQIKDKIINPDIKVVSFDMFDTLIARPFLVPLDMFSLLNRYFIDLFNPIAAIDFSRIRIKSEAELRNINYKNNISEVTLDEIYQYISDYYDLDIKKLNLKQVQQQYMYLH